MTTMGVTVYCNRVQINNNDQEQLMLLRTLHDNESNILGNQTHLITSQKGLNLNNNNSNNLNVLPPYDPTRLKKHGKNGQPPPVAVAKRNARERNRVKQVNNGFATLRQHIPSHIAAGYGDRGKKLSKVETLRMAVEYIRGLQRLLADADGIDYDNNSNSQHNVPSPSSSIVSSSHNGSGERIHIDDDNPDDDDDRDIIQDDDDENKRSTSTTAPTATLSRLSPIILTTSISSRDYYNHQAGDCGDEENLEPTGAIQQHTSTINQTYSRLSPTSLASPQTDYYNQNEENLEPRILSPYSGAGDSEEGGTIYAASPEAFSGSLYYKQEISESGEFMDVVSWWEQEQGRLVHHTQPHAQRLAHV